MQINEMPRIKRYRGRLCRNSTDNQRSAYGGMLLSDCADNTAEYDCAAEKRRLASEVALASSLEQLKANLGKFAPTEADQKRREDFYQATIRERAGIMMFGGQIDFFEKTARVSSNQLIQQRDTHGIVASQHVDAICLDYNDIERAKSTLRKILKCCIRNFKPESTPMEMAAFYRASSRYYDNISVIPDTSTYWQYYYHLLRLAKAWRIQFDEHSLSTIRVRINRKTRLKFHYSEIEGLHDFHDLIIACIMVKRFKQSSLAESYELALLQERAKKHDCETRLGLQTMTLKSADSKESPQIIAFYDEIPQMYTLLRIMRRIENGAKIATLPELRAMARQKAI